MFTRRILAFTLLLSVPLAAQEPVFQATMSLARADESPHQAGDVSGGWKGTVVTNGVAIPLHLILRREGDAFTATAGPTADQQIPLSRVSVGNGVVRFPLGRSGNVELRLVDERLVGGVLQPAAAPSPPAKGLDAAIARVDAMAAEEFGKESLASATVGIVSGSTLLWTKSYGLADIEGNKPATRASVYRIGSITKQFTAVMLLQLAGQGKVHFTDAAEKYVPELSAVPRWYPGAPPVTLLELATHTAGLIAEPEDRATYVKGPVAKWEETTLAAIPKLKYGNEPGTHYSYSNIGYALLGLALGRAAQQPYTEYVPEHIFVPLGMSHTGFEPDPAMREHLARGYVIRDGKADPNEAAAELESGRGYKVPNGAIFTTVDDLARFVSFEMGDGPEPVLPRKVILDNLSRTSSANGDLTSAYGCGFSLRRNGDFVIAGHAGAVAGYTASAYFHPASHLGVIVLRNATGRAFAGDFVLRALETLAK